MAVPGTQEVVLPQDVGALLDSHTLSGGGRRRPDTLVWQGGELPWPGPGPAPLVGGSHPAVSDPFLVRVLEAGGIPLTHFLPHHTSAPKKQRGSHHCPESATRSSRLKDVGLWSQLIPASATCFRHRGPISPGHLKFGQAPDVLLPCSQARFPKGVTLLRR